MTVDEFLDWTETEPDSYELVDGALVRMPDEKQGGRRLGNLMRAAELAFGEQGYGDWLDTKKPELGDTEPYLYVCDSWSHLCAALQLLRDPEDGVRLLGDTFRDICDRAERLATIERQRAAAQPTADAGRPRA